MEPDAPGDFFLHFVLDPIPAPARMGPGGVGMLLLLGSLSPRLAALGKVEFRAGAVGILWPQIPWKRGRDGAGAIAAVTSLVLKFWEQIPARIQTLSVLGWVWGFFLEFGGVWIIPTPSHAPIGFDPWVLWDFWDLCPIFTAPWGPGDPSAPFRVYPTAGSSKSQKSQKSHPK